MGPSIEEIREILQIFLDSELEDLRLEIGDVRLAVSKGGAAGLAAQPFVSSAPRPAAAAPAGEAAAEAAPAPSPAHLRQPPQREPTLALHHPLPI